MIRPPASPTFRTIVLLMLIAASAGAGGARKDRNTSQSAGPRGDATTSSTPLALVREAAQPLTGDADDYDPLMD